MKCLIYCCVIVGVLACKHDSEKIFSNFYIRFDDNTGTVNAEAVFFKGDTLERATPFIPANGVFFDGGLMEQKDLGKRGIVFRSERSVDAKPYFTYAYKNIANKEETFEIKVPYLNNLRIDKSEVLLDSGFQLKWNGVPLLRNESLVLLLTDATQHDKNLEFQGPTTSSMIQIEASALQGLTPGTGSLAVVKKTDQLDRIGNNRRGYQAEFYSKPISVNLVK